MSNIQPSEYLASNTPHPFFMIFEDEKYIYYGNKIVNIQTKEKAWEYVHFVWVESEQNKGSSLYFTIPVA